MTDLSKARAAEEAPQAPSVARNRDPILSVLQRALPEQGTVLEIASGTGEHAAYFAAAFPHLAWLPTDYQEEALAGIGRRRAAAHAPNLLPPLVLDAAADEWPVTRAAAVVAINMVHISPWAATAGLLAGAGRVLPADGVLYLYGAYKENGAHTAPSNAAFDADLRRRNPQWGIRDREAVQALAGEHWLVLAERVEMPANNLSLIFRRRRM